MLILSLAHNNIRPFKEATTTRSTTTSVARSPVPITVGTTLLASASGNVAKSRSLGNAAVPAIRGRHVEEWAAPQKLSWSQVSKYGLFGKSRR